MALRFQTPPEKAVRSIDAALDALKSTPIPGFGIDGALALAYPHVIYHLGLDDLAGGKGLDAAKPVGWGHIAGPLLIETKFDTHELSQLNQGPFGVGITNSIARAESQGGDYEVNVLRIPGIYLLALWLKGSEDALVPVAPAPQEFEADRFYRSAEFMGIAQRLAQTRLAFDNSPQKR
jgi:hypothetical protein